MSRLSDSTNEGLDEGKFVTSIRLRRSTKHFLQTQAKGLGISMHAVIAMILQGFETLSRPAAPADTATPASRFLQLMQSHGLSLVDIVDIMSADGVKLSALGDASRLASLLTANVIASVARCFYVSPDWLTGTEERALPTTRWTPVLFGAELEAARREHHNPAVTLVRAALVDRPYSDDAVAVIRREHVVNSTEFVTLQVCRFDRFTNASIVEQLDAIAAVCRGFGIPISGIEVSSHRMHELACGTALPVQTLSCLLPRRWEPAGPWGHTGPALTPTAARGADSGSFASSEPATTIDLHADLARQQKPSANN